MYNNLPVKLTLSHRESSLLLINNSSEQGVALNAGCYFQPFTPKITKDENKKKIENFILKKN